MNLFQLKRGQIQLAVLCLSAILSHSQQLIKFYLTIPVGSVSCERSFSALRRLKLWTRSMEERLSGLAMPLIHRDTPSPEDIYERKANWRQVKQK